MKNLKRLFSVFFSIMIIFAVISFYGCKDKDEDTNYIDLEKSLSAYQNYVYYNNLFLSDMYQKYASDENIAEINWFYKDWMWNIHFEDIIKQLKTYTEDSLQASAGDIIERTSNTLGINSRGDVLKLHSSDDYKSLKIFIESNNSLTMYEFICTGEGAYSSQFVFKTDLSYLIYQMKFDGLNGEIAVYHNQSEYYSIYSDGLKNNFANNDSASYYFD